MSESNERLLKVVRHCQESLDRYTEDRNEGKLLHYLEKLYGLPIKVVHLEETGVGRTVNGLRKLGGRVGDSSKSLVLKWKDMVVGEQRAEENEAEEDDEDEDDEDDDDDDEDGYQTGEELSDSDESVVREEKTPTISSSHKKSDKNRTDDAEKIKKDKRSSSKSDRSSESSSSKRERDRHSKHHSHHKHKSHKRKSDEANSDDETPKKRSKTSDDKERYKKRRTESDEESRNHEKKYKSDKHRSESKKKSRESSEVESSHKSSRSKEKHHRESSGKDKSKKKHTSTTEDYEKKSKHKDIPKERSEERHSKKEKIVNGDLVKNGIDSGSGASFAEALGMCEPSSSKGSTKKKTVEKKEKPTSKPDDLVPKPLKEPNVEPLDINLSSLLPSITPNYRPLSNLISPEAQPKRLLSESETLSNIISSKNQRTKVYSGNKCGNGKVTSLFEICIRVLQENIDALEYTGGIPYDILKPILERATPNQLHVMEHHNPYLIEDTDELWQLHCQKDFRNKQRQEMETWREMYLRCLDERDAKLKALTANIKQAQDKSLPVRMTKLAYVDAVAKPPRNIAKKQAKNGTALDIRKPSPSAKLSSLATSGDAGKIAVPNPGSRSSGHAPKPKKAPLMLKSISSFKNRFKR